MQVAAATINDSINVPWMLFVPVQLRLDPRLAGVMIQLKSCPQAVPQVGSSIILFRDLLVGLVQLFSGVFRGFLERWVDGVVELCSGRAARWSSGEDSIASFSSSSPAATVSFSEASTSLDEDSVKGSRALQPLASAPRRNRVENRETVI